MANDPTLQTKKRYVEDDDDDVCILATSETSCARRSRFRGLGTHTFTCHIQQLHRREATWAGPVLVPQQGAKVDANVHTQRSIVYAGVTAA